MLSRIRRDYVSIDEAVQAKNHISPQGHGCLTCLKLLDREGLCEGQSLNFDSPVQPRTWVEFYGEHHGISEIVRIDMGSQEWTVGDACARFAKMGLFDPLGHNAANLAGTTSLANEYDEPEKKPLVVVPR